VGEKTQEASRGTSLIAAEAFDRKVREDTAKSAKGTISDDRRLKTED
jgi:hypothetical protein